MDNLGSHKGKAVRQAIRAAGAKLIFLPKYSPDLNPIEQVFAKLKHLLRKAAARTIETLTAAVGELLGAFTVEECANYFVTQGMREPKIIPLYRVAYATLTRRYPTPPRPAKPSSITPRSGWRRL